MDQEPRESGLSRRSALRKIGAGTAVAWTAPAIMSMATPAAAAGSAPTSGHSAIGSYCYRDGSAEVRVTFTVTDTPPGGLLAVSFSGVVVTCVPNCVVFSGPTVWFSGTTTSTTSTFNNVNLTAKAFDGGPGGANDRAWGNFEPGVCTTMSDPSHGPFPIYACAGTLGELTVT